jgi:RNA polymerase subunit RPABC4/transcription elongation factor Spt4
MFVFDDLGITQFLLTASVVGGVVFFSTWLGMILWAWRDIRARSRDVMAQIAGTGVVVALHVFGLLLYVMLRPRETLAEAYERSLEEEALLQSIEEKPVCPGCGRPSNTRWQVCPYCYTRLKKPCVNCNELLELSWNLCPVCAVAQPKTQEKAQSPRRARQRREAEPSLEFVEGGDEV